MSSSTNRAIIAVLAVLVIIVTIVIATQNQGNDGSGGPLPAATSTTSTMTSSSSPSSPSSPSLTGVPTSTAPMHSAPSAPSSTAQPTSMSYRGPSFSFNYPANWKVESALPFVIDNFNGNYGPGGVIPIGGAEVDVVTTTLYGPLQNVLGTELMTASDLSTSTIAVNGTACVEASYEGDYVPGANSMNRAVYCVRGNELWKMYLSFQSGDPAASAHLAVFGNMLSSMKLMP